MKRKGQPKAHLEVVGVQLQEPSEKLDGLGGMVFKQIQEPLEFEFGKPIQRSEEQSGLFEPSHGQMDLHLDVEKRMLGSSPRNYLCQKRVKFSKAKTEH